MLFHSTGRATDCSAAHALPPWARSTSRNPRAAINRMGREEGHCQHARAGLRTNTPLATPGQGEVTTVMLRRSPQDPCKRRTQLLASQVSTRRSWDLAVLSHSRRWSAVCGRPTTAARTPPSSPTASPQVLPALTPPEAKRTMGECRDFLSSPATCTGCRMRLDSAG